MSFIVMIPARYASTRLPGKALAEIEGKPMIEYVVDCANQSDASRVIVATDDERVQAALRDKVCEVFMSDVNHQSGSERLSEVANKLDIDDEQIIVNVQGDEPLVPGKLIDQVAAALEIAGDAVIATAAKAIEDEQELNNPNVVKVVFARTGKALYFSRSPIPYARDERFSNAWKHIGIYAL